jgi:hypothetical protein
MERNPELWIMFLTNVEFIVMPSKLGETNLRADYRGFYSAFYRSGTLTERLGFDRSSTPQKRKWL